MKSVFSWFINMAAIAFWIFRVIVLVLSTLSIDFIIKPINEGIEIPMLFITVICLVLIFKRNILGGILYFAIYSWYFGTEIYNGLVQNSFSMSSIISILAITIAILNLFDIVLSKNKVTTKSLRGTDWFYKNEKFDRELDERADKNNYRIH